MIEGTLRDLPLSDVFQTVVTGQKTGTLTVVHGLSRARIYFETGRLQTAHVSPGAHLGELMVRLDLLTALEVQQLLRVQASENAGTPLGLQAVAEGLLDEADLRRALEQQMFEAIAEVLAWEDGEFVFSEQSLLASQVPTEHTVDAMMLLMRVAQEMTEFEEGAVEPGALLRRSGDPTRVEMPAGGWEVLGHVDGKRTARSIASELDLSERQVYTLLHQLTERGILEPLPFEMEEPLVLVASRSSALQRILRLALQRARIRSHEALDYDDALERARRERPSGVVVDDVDGEGWGFVRELRRLPGFAHLPVVVLTEADDGGFFARLRRPKAEVLEKPVREFEFQQTIARALGRSVV